MFVIVSRDITERRRLEAQFLQSQKMESVGRLAGGIAHDFNNLLTAITGYTSLALEALPADHLAHSDLQEIQRAADRAANLTNQLLSFARKRVIAPSIFSLNDLIRGMESLPASSECSMSNDHFCRFFFALRAKKNLRRMIHPRFA